jgi:HK97 family phage major capsid protein
VRYFDAPKKEGFMNRYKALLDERAQLVAEGKGIFDAAEKAGHDLTDAEKARDDEINARLETIKGDLAREEARRERERAVEPVRDPQGQARARGLTPLDSQDPRAGFAHLADFALSVVQASRPGGRMDERLQALQYGAAPADFHQEAGTAEGYLVPTEFRQAIWGLVFNGDDILGMVSPEPTSSNSVELEADESTPWGATGVTAKWRSEASQMVAQKIDPVDPRMVKLYELYAFVTASDELLRDAPRMNSRLTNKAAMAIRWKASEAIIRGTGAGQPLGWMKSAALVSVAKEDAQVKDTIVTDNVTKMYTRLLDMPGGKPRWLANRDIVPQLMKLVIGDQPMWTPPVAGLREAPGGFLLGLPIQWSEHAETLGDQGDLQLIDPVGYYATQREDGPQFASSIHLYFDYGLQAFRWTFRFGGQPYLSAPVSPAKGANTRSHFVVLDARA